MILLNNTPKTRDEILEELRRLKTAYGDLFEAVAALLYRHDPSVVGKKPGKRRRFEREYPVDSTT